jgi:hypothetical protein
LALVSANVYSKDLNKQWCHKDTDSPGDGDCVRLKLNNGNNSAIGGIVSCVGNETDERGKCSYKGFWMKLTSIDTSNRWITYKVGSIAKVMSLNGAVLTATWAINVDS